MRVRTKITTSLILLSFLLIAAVFVTGCSKRSSLEKAQQSLQSHSGNYSTVAAINYKELKAVAKMSQETPSSCSVVFESPPSLAGMGFVFRQDDVDVNYKGLSFTFARKSMPHGVVANLAVSAINKAMKDDGMTVSVVDGSLEVKGTMESGEFIIKVDQETGNLMKLSVPAEELEIEFSNFRFLD